MYNELRKLEETVDQLILTNARLRAENHHLRQQLAQFQKTLPVEPTDTPEPSTPATELAP